MIAQLKETWTLWQVCACIADTQAISNKSQFDKDIRPIFSFALEELLEKWLDRFGCKLWLQSIQNYANLRLTSFPSFCAPPSEEAFQFESEQTVPDTLFSDRSSI